MSQHGQPSTKPRRSTGTIIGGVLLVVALFLCGGGGGLLIGPAVRASQDMDAGVIGMAVFDMHDGDDYWIYQPAGGTWPPSMDCVLSGPEHTYHVARADRPLTAPERITDLGDEYTFYGTLRGDRTEAFVLVECPLDEFLLVPSRSPIWYLGATLAAGTLAGLVGLAVIVATAVRRRRRRMAPPAPPVPAGPLVASGSPVSSGPPSPHGHGSGPVLAGTAPSAPPRRASPSPRWYLVALPFLLSALCFCAVGSVAGLLFGFTNSFEAPEIGSPRGVGAVASHYLTGIEYVLYADVADAMPNPAGCMLHETYEEFVPPRPLGLQTARAFGVAETVTVNERTYRYVGAFRVDQSLLGTVRCDQGSSLLARPSERSRVLVFSALGLATVALALGAVVGFRVRKAARNAASEAAPAPVPAR